ncbi:ABC-type multidrug transport system fused ATPase/permease subunit [Microbacterium phyllosphaerae]|uniref:ABC-type multidrug transport system fused ATPase/permease subunit n=1 Tax=Microbacterium phyllosphaerae TaxID=124798 RepID=A0ABS4WPL6_9MICO|nr:SHOCT domain-containing protein [Microbacterium phyllosphaerae]MBP2378106.1 ABC-type multidrug transport system fused ATPase/permease subunit [Microbacterium phyllosphaerae]
MSIWDLVAWFFWSFVFISYLMVVFTIIGDIFRDSSLNGWLKAVWIIFLVFLPFLTSLVYLIARGQGMAERRGEQLAELRAAQTAYIRETAGSSSPADDITKARGLLDSGVITQSEFETLKAKALAS